MQSSINTLVADIQHLVTTKGWFTDELGREFSSQVSKRLQDQYSENERPATLRLSKMGANCPKALWYSIHASEQAEPLPPWAEVKFSFGHIIEALAIALAKASGHRVEGEQDEVTVNGVSGHRDCVIDGVVVDVKSTSSIGFKKFKDRSIAQMDSFGYLDQLDGYILGSANDPLVQVKDRGYLLAIDKQLGHMVLYEHILRRDSILRRITEATQIVALTEPPRCTCETVPDGKAGNIRLGIKASYSPQKYCCFPNLRTFIYSDGPRYLTHVERTPDVPEVFRPH